ncbi:MAG: hypothetical protein Q8R11_03655 [bacterium]|nr:hypothetical protein [bacterium]
MWKAGLFVFVFVFLFLFSDRPIGALEPNNRFGIHVSDPSDLPLAQELVNSSGGDWGYITIVIQDNDRDTQKWQVFFDDARQRHLIPLVRLATHPVYSNWEKPMPDQAEKWATFLDDLNWPTKQRHVIIFNEPNHASEWGGSVNPTEYAEVLKSFRNTLKAASSDFVVLNAGLDAAAPDERPRYMDLASFLVEMNRAVPGIFSYLDGWSSHSYPNPAFRGTPGQTGKMSIRGYAWERAFLSSQFGVSGLPIYITESGWPHAEGISEDRSFYSAEYTAEFIRSAFQFAWNDPDVVAVTPFILRYKDKPFDHFSWTKNPTSTDDWVLGSEFPNDDAYPQFDTIREAQKLSGLPKQDERAEIIRQKIPSAMVAGEEYQGSVILRNTGQSIWGERKPVVIKLSPPFLQDPIVVDGLHVEPGQEATMHIPLQAPFTKGTFPLTLTVLSTTELIKIHLEIEIVDPPLLRLIGQLSLHPYTITMRNDEGVTVFSREIQLGKDGRSDALDLRKLQPKNRYTLHIKQQYKLPADILLLTKSGEQELTIPSLRGGDFNDDENFSLGDILTLLRHPSRIQTLF